jgi:hypothetical protein
MIDSKPYLYKWIHLPTNKWYIGSKTQAGWNPACHEKYLCSSKIVKPLILENRNEWEYKILVIGPASYIRKLETSYLTMLDAKNDPMSFNQSNAKFDAGNRLGRIESDITRLKKSLARQGDKNPMYGKRGKLSPHFGKLHSKEVKQKQSIGIKRYAISRPALHNENISKSLKGNPNVGLKGDKNPMFGKTASDYNKQMSKLKNSGDNNPMKQPKHQRTCEYCNKTIAKNHYTMFHGDKCKLKP